MAEAGSSVSIFSTADCGGVPAAAASAPEFAAGLPSPVADNSTNTFSATATDAAGNSSACSAPVQYREDSAAPETTITRGPKALVKLRPKSHRKVYFEFAADDPGATFTCSLDSAPWLPCASPSRRVRLKPGLHHFAVRGTDSAGNVDMSPATRAVRVKVAAKKKRH
jgi:hypothetical protein